MRLYVNGVQAASTTISGLTIDTNANALTLGYMGAYWAGSIDEVALYNSALSSGTVASHYAAGRETATDTNLVTRNVYDALGRKTDLVDPTGIDTHYVYDRLGRVTAGVSNYVAGATSTPTRNVTALAAYDALGEVIATCSANATAAGCGSTITTSNASWHYVYDAAGHQVRAVPPVNAVLTALDETATIYDSSGGRVASIVSCAASAGDNCLPTISNSDRHTDLTYDALGRVTNTVVYLGHGTTAPRLTTVAAYDGLGHQLSVKFTSTTQGEDTIESTYDSLGRVSAMYEGSHDPGNPPGDGNTETQSATYNPDGTVATRTDYKISSTASTFTYDPLGRLIEATSPTFAAGVRVDFVWRLDGLLASRSWSTGPAALVYGYDGAKRPIKECNGAAGACGGAQIDIERTYDRVGNVLTETQNISGAAPSQNGTQTFSYDALNRVISSAINDAWSYKVDKSYTYDSDGNRLSVTVNTVNTDTFTFDATDQTISDNTVAFTYDRHGNLTHSSTSAASSTSYAYDLADRLNSITQADGSTVGFTFDAAGRHATRTSGGTTTDTYAYLGTTDSVLADNTVYSALDSMGDRLATKTTAALGWIVPDLHGNVAVQCSASGSVIDVFRYDAYGKALGTPNSPSSIPTPWRFQGRILESTAGTDTYDFGARSYVPDLGTFTSLDSVTGSAQNPLTLNRYLYANANPATLVDPDGHGCVDVDKRECAAAIHAKAKPKFHVDPVFHILVDADGAAVLPGQIDFYLKVCILGGVDALGAPCDAVLKGRDKRDAAVEQWKHDHPAEWAAIQKAQSDAHLNLFADVLLTVWAASELGLNPLADSADAAAFARTIEENPGLANVIEDEADLDQAEFNALTDGAGPGSTPVNKYGGYFNYPTTNQVGGTVFTSEGPITQSDFAPLVRRALYDGGTPVNILSGVHGDELGNIAGDPKLLAADLAQFGGAEGVNIYNWAGLDKQQIMDLVNGPGTTILGFCWSGACLATYE